jgi:hypothetical protein
MIIACIQRVGLERWREVKKRKEGRKGKLGENRKQRRRNRTRENHAISSM